MSNKTCCLYIIISIIDLYINYNETYFPEFHEKRVKFNAICLFIYLAPIFILIFALCSICCIFALTLFLVILSILGFYYAISSFFLYFAYDGYLKIKNPLIHIFLWISFLSYLLNLIILLLSCCFGKTKNNIEEEQNYYLLN